MFWKSIVGAENIGDFHLPFWTIWTIQPGSEFSAVTSHGLYQDKARESRDLSSSWELRISATLIVSVASGALSICSNSCESVVTGAGGKKTEGEFCNRYRVQHRLPKHYSDVKSPTHCNWFRGCVRTVCQSGNLLLLLLSGTIHLWCAVDVNCLRDKRCRHAVVSRICLLWIFLSCTRCV